MHLALQSGISGLELALEVGKMEGRCSEACAPQAAAPDKPLCFETQNHSDQGDDIGQMNRNNMIVLQRGTNDPTAS